MAPHSRCLVVRAGLLASCISAVACTATKPTPAATVEEEPEDIEGTDPDAATEVADSAPPGDAKTDAKPDIKPDVKTDADTGIDVEDATPPDATDEPDAGIEDLPDGVLAAADGGAESGATEVGGVSDADVGLAPETAPDAGTDVPDSSDGGGPDAPEVKLPPPDKACTSDADCADLTKDICTAKFKCITNAKGENKCVGFFKSDGAACDDGKPCTAADHCVAGDCIGIPKLCLDEDNNPCTLEVCDTVKGCPAKGKGAYSALDTPCSDDNKCTVGDACDLVGQCKSGVNNKCECTKNDDCKPFDDGNPCNGTLACKFNTCVVDTKTIVTCPTDKDTACQTSLCAPATGKCGVAQKSDGLACDDGSSCTFPDLCEGGLCKAAAVKCNDGNSCTTDSCDPKAGCKNDANAVLCNDGDKCTSADTCTNGACTGNPSKELCACTTDNDCPNDADKCNGALACVSNTCVLTLGSAVVCPLSGPCTVVACNPLTGQCVAQDKAPGEPCDDGSACTFGDKCGPDGKCSEAKKVVCADGNPCTDEACLADVGCVVSYNQAPCNDADYCTAPDTCVQGKCVGVGTACQCEEDADCAKKDFTSDKCAGIAIYQCDTVSKQCEEKTQAVPKVCAAPGDNPCVFAACDPKSGQCDTKPKADGLTCSDGDPCSTKDKCTFGVCKGVGAIETGQCDDGNPCTADICESKATPDTCKHDSSLLEGGACSDGSACTKADLCKNGKCFGSAVSCDDGNACTDDVCDTISGCIKSSKAKGSPCSDNNPCTGDAAKAPQVAMDVCGASGGCVAGGAKVCNDAKPCTDDSCDPLALPASGIDDKQAKTGCVFLYNDATCVSGDACITDAICKNGLCGVGGSKPVVCDDKNPCTADSCKAASGCKAEPTSAACDDGNACTKDDVCAAAACGGAAVACNDENACTKDACDPAKGCTFTATKGDCGAFASCGGPDPTKPTCVFGGSSHLLISEVYAGVAWKADDDFIEIYNPTTATVDLADYELGFRALAGDVTTTWVSVPLGKKGDVIFPFGYVVAGGKGPAAGGIAFDVVSPDFKLNPLAQHIRLRDKTFGVVHDGVAWAPGSAAVIDAADTPATAKVGTPFDSSQWPSPRSLERKATANSTLDTMAPHKSEWLGGNLLDNNDCAADFLVRWTPEPQPRTLNRYEPACGGTCPVAKICDYGGSGFDKCVADKECLSFGVEKALACGAGKVCSSAIGECVVDSKRLVFSQLYFGTAALTDHEYIELYNGSASEVDLSGCVIQVKGPSAVPGDAWVKSPLQFPAGTLAPKNSYVVVATKTFAETGAGVDFVVQTSLGLGAMQTGSTVRLWDPRTDVELDLVGWGTAKTFSGAAVVGGGPAPAPYVGAVLERKASIISTSATLDEFGAGTQAFAGNGYDTNVDNKDWVVMGEPHPHSLASGVYEPACGGTCKIDTVCNFVVGQEACVLPDCGGVCFNEPGAGCNVKSNAASLVDRCTRYVMIAEFATEGDKDFVESGGKTLPPAYNEYVLLYNPTAASVQLKGLALQYFPAGGGNPLAMTSTGSATIKALDGAIEAFSYFLVVPRFYVGTLKGKLAPDFVANIDWNLDSAKGAIRLARLNGKYPPEKINGNADLVAWGVGMEAQAEGKAPTVPQVGAVGSPGKNGALRRRPEAPAWMEPPPPTAIFDNQRGWLYAGHGHDTQNNAKDFVANPGRSLRTKQSPPQKP
ncbi:MAG: hypothetical protein EXR79_10330 [Myxococcales bacterium]|nr:hypothetical protein [Myxococcales bacterium]